MDEFGEHARLVAPLASLSAASDDMEALLRAVSSTPLRSIGWRDDRPYLVASAIQVQ